MNQETPGIRIEDKLRLLERENDLLNRVIQSANDSIYAKDLDGKYITINQKGADYLGKPVEDIVGKTDEELFETDGKLFMERDAALFQSGNSITYENKALIEDQTTHFWTNKSPLTDTNGNIIGLIGISRNIKEAKQAEDKYRFMFDNAPIAFWEEDFSEVKKYLDELRKSGVSDFRKHFTENQDALDECTNLIKVLNINKATLAMNGTSDKETLIPNLNHNFTPESQTLFIDEIVALAEGKTSFQTDCSFVNKHGDVLEVIFNLNVLPGHEETLSLVLISVVDVSDMSKLKTELTNVKHRYQSIVEAQTEMICRLNPKGEVMFQNVAFTKFFSFKTKKNGDLFTMLFPPDAVPQCQEALSKLTNIKANTTIELRNYDSQGTLVWQEWSITAFFGKSGLLLGYQAVGTDVTDRKNAQEALAASEARWRSVFNHADDLIVTLNTSGYILSINDYAGLPENAKWAGKKVDEVLSPENATSVLQLLNAVLSLGKPTKTEVDITLPNGKIITFGVALSPITYGKRIISVVCIARDITETKQLENKTKEALIEGQEKERMRVSQELHDGLGQLFTAIKLNLQQIQANVDNHPNLMLRENIDKLETHVGQAITEVKNISRNLMPDVLWHFGLKPAVEDFIEKLNGSTEVKISLEMVEIDDRFPKEIEQALFRVCQELVNNALRHAKPKNIYVQLINHTESLMLIVEDDGIGFNPSSVTRGFGLKNIQSRVGLMNGDVDIDSSEGKGSVTTVEIPLSSNPPG